MSDILSNEQIDQLLSANGMGNAPREEEKPDASAGGVFGQICGVFCRQMSSVVTTVLSRKAVAEVLRCEKTDAGTVREALGGETLCLAIPFAKGFAGEMYFVLKKKDVAVICDLMMLGDGNAAYVPEHNDAILELSNQISSSFAVAFSAETGMQVAMAPSTIAAYSPESSDNPAIMAAKLSVEGREDAPVALIVPGGLYEQMTKKNTAGAAQGVWQDTVDNGGTIASLQESAPGGRYQKENIDLLLDVDLDVNIELGRSTLSIKRILELAPGSIVELDRMAGEPVDLLVNNKVVAKGEVVVIDENFGIRILSLVSPEERIKSLR
jgi:flagellar motor switch protein FliN